MSSSSTNHTDRLLRLRQQIQGYLREPTAEKATTSPLFDACILWDPRKETPLASCGRSARTLAQILAQKARSRELPRPTRNAKIFFESETGCVFLSYELWEMTGLIFAMSLPIAANAAVSTCRLFESGKNARVLGAQAAEKRTDEAQIMRLAALFDLIEATRDKQFPQELRAEALAAIFVLSEKNVDQKAIPSSAEANALVDLLCRLMQTATMQEKEGDLVEKI